MGVLMYALIFYYTEVIEMLQTYSSNLAVEANAPFVFNNVVVDKGCGESLSAPSTIQLNKRGVYLVEMDGFATPDAATEVSVQLYVNNVAQPQAISTFVPEPTLCLLPCSSRTNAYLG